MLELEHILKLHGLNYKLGRDIYEFNRMYYDKFNEVEEFIAEKQIIKFEYNKKMYDALFIELTDKYSYSIHSDKDNDNDCFLIFINKNFDKSEKNYAFIQYINGKTYNSYVDFAHGVGEKLLQLTVAFIKSIKDIYKLEYIQSKDNIALNCIDTMPIELSNLCMLTTGNTLYGKYGFKPFNAYLKQYDFDKYIDYKINQKIVNIIKINYTQIKDIMLSNARSERHNGVEIVDIIRMYKDYKSMSVKDFLHLFMKNFHASYKIYYDIHSDILRELKMSNFYGTSYFYEL